MCIKDICPGSIAEQEINHFLNDLPTKVSLTQKRKLASKFARKMFIKRRVSPNSEVYWKQRGWRSKDIPQKLKESKKNCPEYWLCRGYNKKDAESASREFYISKVRPNHQKYLDGRSREFLRTSSVRCVEYWMARGYTNAEAKRKVSEVQATFSLEKCISNHGKEDGYQIWKDRQDRWQQTLNARSPDEIERTNKSKGTDKSGVPLPGGYSKAFFKRAENKTLTGFMYYAKITNKKRNTVYYKIGITKNTFEARAKEWINHPYLDVQLVGLWEGLLEDAFVVEQRILKEFSYIRTRDDKTIKSTELFTEDIIDEIKNKNKISEILKERTIQNKHT